MKRSSTKF